MMSKLIWGVFIILLGPTMIYLAGLEKQEAPKYVKGVYSSDVICNDGKEYTMVFSSNHQKLGSVLHVDPNNNPIKCEILIDK